MSTPRISVLLPVYNGAATILPSVRSLLAQSFRDFELLVVDDGSSDGTAELLRTLTDPRLRVLRHERNLGLTRSLNHGLREARGAWIARQDADDLSAPERLGLQMEFVTAHPRTVLLGTSGWRIDPHGRATGSNDLPCTPLALAWASVTDNPFLHTSVLFAREVVLQDGGYDDSFAICQDFELWSRLAERHPVANLPGRLVAMREHASSMTRTDAQGTSDEADRVLARTWSTLLPGCPLAAHEAALLRSFRLRFPSRDWPALRALLERLFARYCTLHPGAARDPDLRATRARQSLRVAWKLFRASPAAALAEVVRAFAMAPGETCRQATTALLAPTLAPAWITAP